MLDAILIYLLFFSRINIWLCKRATECSSYSPILCHATCDIMSLRVKHFAMPENRAMECPLSSTELIEATYVFGWAQHGGRGRTGLYLLNPP